MLSRDVPSIGWTICMLLVCCWLIQRQRGSVMYMLSWVILKQQRAVDMHALLSR
jgi:hypothetical protein